MATFSGDIIRRNSGDSVEKVAVKEGPRHGVAADESRVQDRTGTVQVAVQCRTTKGRPSMFKSRRAKFSLDNLLNWFVMACDDMVTKVIFLFQVSTYLKIKDRLQLRLIIISYLPNLEINTTHN